MKIRSILPVNRTRRLIACAILVLTFLFWSKNIVQVSALTTDRPSSKHVSLLLPTPTGEGKQANEESRREAVRAAQQEDREEASPVVTRHPELVPEVEGQEPPVVLRQAQEPGSATTCTNGLAGEYPCQNVDLMSVLPLAAIGGGGGTDIWGWTDSQTGKEYALMTRTNGTSFVDISDPEAPIYLGNLPSHTGTSIWRDVKVYQNHAFIVADFNGDHGVQIFDLTQLRDVTSPPVEFSETAHYDQIGSAHNIVINEQTGYAYAVGVSSGDQSCHGGLHMINIQNPTEPTFAGCFGDDGYTHDAQCVTYNGPDSDYKGQEICFNANEDTLTIVNVNDKSNPQMLSRTAYTGSRYTHQNWLTEDQRYLLMNDEVDETGNGHNTRTYIWDVSNLDEPTLIGAYTGPTPSIDHNLYTHQGYAYEANYTSGLRILNLSDIANGTLQEVAYFDIYPDNNNANYNGAWSVYPYFESGTVIVSGIEGGLFVLRPQLSANNQTPTPTPTPSGSSTPSNTPTITATDTPTPSPTASNTPTITATDTPSPSPTASNTSTMIPTHTPGPSPTASNTPTVTRTHTPGSSPTATKTHTPSLSPTATNTHTPGDGDAYEQDERCTQASTIATDGSVQVHTFHDEADEDWMAFQATEAITYVVEARVPPGSTANLVLELYEACESGSLGDSDPPVNPDIRMSFQPPATGTYYLRLFDNDPTTYGPDVAYHVSVRALQDTVPSSALILVAGRRRDNDPQQDNIHLVTNRMYEFATTHGCTTDQIAYLATDTQLEGVTSRLTFNNLQEAITEWAVDKVEENGSLTIYMMDHGEHDLLYLDDTQGERMTPLDLDEWLDQFEEEVPGAKVNVVVEACNSGSFIDPNKSVSAPGRVVMTSTSPDALAYTSQDGAAFSDTFLGGLKQGMSLYSAFEEGQWAANQGHPDQEAWLDDNGDAAYTPADGLVAAQRSLTCAPIAPGQNFPPNIEEVEVRDLSGIQGQIWAKVQDDQQVDVVWAVPYPPSYDPEAGNEMVAQPVPVPLLSRGDGWYASVYAGFDEIGEYRLVVSADDDQGLQSRSLEMRLQTGYELYLPTVIR